MKHNRIKTLTRLFRIFSQVIFFVLLPGLYTNAFLGIRLIYQGIMEQNFSFSLASLISTIAIIPITLFFGRFFCGWMCAFGSLGDLLYSFSQKVFKTKFKINRTLDEALKYVKYLILIFIIVIVWTFQLIDITPLSPSTAFGSLLPFNGLPDFSYVITEITIGFALLIAIMSASLFIERFFCRYLCPMGAVFAIISRLRILRIKKPSAACGSCNACTKKCPMGISLNQMNTVTSGECINCMNCVQICPRENAGLALVAAPTNPALAGALAVTAMTGVYYISSFVTDTPNAALGVSPSSAVVSENNTLYADGTYQGSGTGYRGATTTVSVTIKNDIITDIETVSFGDDAPFYNASFDSVVSQIIDSQSTDVDAVSGATFSSMGITEAVSNALESARQALNASTGNSDSPNSNSDDSTDNSSFADVTAAADVTEDISDSSATDSLPSSENTEADSKSYSSKSINSAPAPTAKSSLKSSEAKTKPSSASTSESSSNSKNTASNSSSDTGSSSDTKSTAYGSSSDTKSSPSTKDAVSTVSDPESSSYLDDNIPDESSSDAEDTVTATITPSDTKDTVSATPSVTETTSSVYKDGTYTGSATGFRRGITTVAVTIKDNVITDIQIVSNGDDAPFFNRASGPIISDILSNQSSDVDAVSGATFSSMGIMNAVADAISKAKPD